jgi:hypothetical protein
LSNKIVKVVSPDDFISLTFFLRWYRLLIFWLILQAWQYLLFTGLQMNDSRSFVITSTTGTATLEEVARKKVGDTTTGFFPFALIFLLTLPFSPQVLLMRFLLGGGYGPPRET